MGLSPNVPTVLDPATYAKLANAVYVLAADPKATLEKLVNSAKGQAQDAMLGLYLDWLQKDSKELGARAGYVTGQALVDAVALGIGVVKNGSKVLDKPAGLMDGLKARISDDIALNTMLKNGGVISTNGIPLLDLKQLTIAQKEMAGVIFGQANGVLSLAPDAVQLGRVAVGKTGIDDLYKVNRPNVDYIIVEYKFGSSGLSKTVDGSRQMSDPWLLGPIPGNVGF